MAAGLRDGALDGLEGLWDLASGAWGVFTTAVRNPGQIDDMIGEQVDAIQEILGVVGAEIEAGNWDTVVVEFLLPMLGIDEELISDRGLDYGIAYAIASNPDVFIPGSVLARVLEGISNLRAAGRLNPPGNRRGDADVDINTRVDVDVDAPTVDIDLTAQQIDDLDIDGLDLSPPDAGDLVTAGSRSNPPGSAAAPVAGRSPLPDSNPPITASAPASAPNGRIDLDPVASSAQPSRGPDGDGIDLDAPDREPALVGADNSPDVSASVDTPMRTPAATPRGGDGSGNGGSGNGGSGNGGSGSGKGGGSGSGGSGNGGDGPDIGGSGADDFGNGSDLDDYGDVDGPSQSDADIPVDNRLITERLRSLTGDAKNAKWVSSNGSGSGLRKHFDKHKERVGVDSVREYDLSARETIDNGRRFKYRDAHSNEPRVGYFDEATGLFTATGQTRKLPAIFSHHVTTWDKLRGLPGFSNGR